MATFNQGIHGKFSGRVGNVVGSTWKGKGVMRIRPASVTNPNTGKQRAQRSRFGMMMRFLQAHSTLLRSGFKPWAKGITAHNAAMSYNMSNAFAGDYPDQVIDYSKAMISLGNLPGVSGFTAETSTPGTLNLSWDNNSTGMYAQSTDKLMVSVYDEAENASAIYMAAASRSDSAAELELPANWSGKTVQILAFFLAENGIGSSDQKQLVSNTSYGGSLVLL